MAKRDLQLPDNRTPGLGGELERIGKTAAYKNGKLVAPLAKKGPYTKITRESYGFTDEKDLVEDEKGRIYERTISHYRDRPTLEKNISKKEYNKRIMKIKKKK